MILFKVYPALVYLMCMVNIKFDCRWSIRE